MSDGCMPGEPAIGGSGLVSPVSAGFSRETKDRLQAEADTVRRQHHPKETNPSRNPFSATRGRTQDGRALRPSRRTRLLGLPGQPRDLHGGLLQGASRTHSNQGLRVLAQRLEVVRRGRRGGE